MSSNFRIEIVNRIVAFKNFNDAAAYEAHNAADQVIEAKSEDGQDLTVAIFSCPAEANEFVKGNLKKGERIKFSSLQKVDKMRLELLVK